MVVMVSIILDPLVWKKSTNVLNNTFCKSVLYGYLSLSAKCSGH